MSNVISLRGDVVVEAAGEPCSILIERLEKLVDRARSGEVQGIGVVCLHADKNSSFELVGRVGGYTMAGACASLAHELALINSAVVEG